MAREFVGVSFRGPKGPKTYTYHNDGPPVAVGETVKLPGAKPGDGWSKGLVVSISTRAPAFETKAILGPFHAEPQHKERVP